MRRYASSGYVSAWLGWVVLVTVLVGCDDAPDVAKPGMRMGSAAFALGVTDCPTGSNVILGSPGDDVIDGTNGDDCIVALDGNDVVRGKAGNDFIIGGPGNDDLRGGAGADQIFGEGGDDTIDGGNGDDVLSGGDGNDDIRGGSGEDTVVGGAGDDVLDGGNGGDVLDGGDGNDTIDGAGGEDTISGGDGNDTIEGGNGSDSIDGGAGDDNISGSSGADDISGGDGNDVISGGNGGDTVSGGDGNDVIDSGGGSDTVDGGAGNDSCDDPSCESGAPSGCTQSSDCPDPAGQSCVGGACVYCQDDSECDDGDACTGVETCSPALGCQGGAPPPPDPEVCDGVDNDCNGLVDDGLGLGDACSEGIGACTQSGVLVCDGSGGVTCNAVPLPPAAADATCDGVDDDCDGTSDEDYASVATSCGVGACAASGATSCVLGTVQDSCIAGPPALDDATCDGIDDDCDGTVDEDCDPDSDGDGLEDADEVSLGTDPLDPDTDDDGLLDGDEVAGGSDPLTSELLGVALDPPNANLLPSDTTPLTAYGYYSFAPTTPQPLLASAVTWSTATGNAVVDSAGNVAGATVGLDTVSATVGVESAQTYARVWDAARLADLVSLTVSPGGVSWMTHGNCVQFQATGNFGDGTSEDLTDVVTWVVGGLSGTGPVGGYGHARLGLGNEGFFDPGLFVANGLRTQYGSAIAELDGLSAYAVFYVGGISAEQQFQGACADARIPGELWGLSFTPGSATLMESETTPIRAYALYEDGSRRPIRDYTRLSWAAVDPAVVDVSPFGWVRGVSTGTGDVEAWFDGVSNSLPITVTGAPALGSLTGLQVEPAAHNPTEGETYEARALASYDSHPGRLFDVTASASWSSDEPTVTDPIAGIGTADTLGTAYITAELAGFTAETHVRVWDAVRRSELTHISLQPGGLQFILAGQCMQFLAVGHFSDGTTEDLTDVSAWSVSHPAAIISYGYYEQLWNAGYISVDAFNWPLGLHATATTYPTGGNANAFSCTGDTDGDGLLDTEELAIGTDYNDPDTDDDGLLDGAESSAGGDPLTYELLGLAVDPASSNLLVGETEQLTAYGYYSFDPHMPIDVTDGVAWSTSTGSFGIDVMGLASADSLGLDTLTASVGSESASANARAWDAARLADLVTITVTPPGVNHLTHGDCLQVTATGEFGDGTTEDLTDLVRWRYGALDGISPKPGFSNARLGLTNEGFVAPGLFVSNGWRTQYATAIAELDGIGGYTVLYIGGISSQQLFAGSCPDPRVPGELWGLDVTPSSTTLMEGEAVELTAYALHADGSSREIRDHTSVGWTTSDPGVADVASSGWGRGVAVGSTQLTATTGAVSTDVPIEVVSAGPLGNLDALFVEPSAHNAVLGDGYELRALASYDGQPGRLFDVTASATWSSSAPGVSDPSGGWGMGDTVGTTTVTATLAPQSASSHVRIWDPARLAELTHIYVEPFGVQFVLDGECFQYSAIGYFDDGTSEDLTDFAEWAVSHPSARVTGGLYRQGWYSSYISVEARLSPFGLWHTGTTYPTGGGSGFVCP